VNVSGMGQKIKIWKQDFNEDIETELNKDMFYTLVHGYPVITTISKLL
jgi:hypothetical protein